MGKIKKAVGKPKQEIVKVPMKAKENAQGKAKSKNSGPRQSKEKPAEEKTAKPDNVNIACSQKTKPSQNWQLFITKIQPKQTPKPHFRKKIEKQSHDKKNKFSDNLTDIVAIDCEMVGGGENGRENLLARVSVVNKFNEVLYDSFVKPVESVTDYRTQYSGVRESDLETAPDFKTVQEKVAGLIDKRILVGHDIKNDLKVLFLGHPFNKIRDTAKYKEFHKLKSGRPSLKFLAEKLLGIKIQSGEHDSIEDAKATMSLYMMHQNEWERLRKEKKVPKEKLVDKSKMRKNWERYNNANKWFAGR